ncbi:Glycosidase [Pustulibacterium marinum]|uniref:Glycosidase n=1 Tax=Pustulibacterium marinum TaxID=1224947 RepID=A0A1I7GE95_9FLAO|nr:alpha-amylase family glycosyl hydrolase [Pustulibacterium marinum]SFU46807.1 Glycosidase [Pustulibacterium marinum]
MKKLFLNIMMAVCMVNFTACQSDDDANTTTQNFGYEQYGEPFAAMPSKEDAIIYQVNIRAFSDETKLQGVQEKLGHIKALGANVVYLMPIYPVGTVNSVNSPYAVKNYKEVNPDFGTLEDLRSLVDAAHEMGLAVVLDWVANHTAWDNNWITEHPDWYLQDEEGNIISPPNTVYTDVAQLDFENEEMKAGMIDAMAYWLYNANVDGFRCDYADAVPDTFWTQAINALRPIKDQEIIMLAEGSDSAHFHAGFDYIFGFNFFSNLEYVFGDGEPATTLQDSNATEYAQVYNNEDRVVRYTTNHDVNLSDGTPLQLFGGKEGSMVAFVLAAYMKSIPMIYNAQEIGYDQQIDYFSENPIDWSNIDYDMLEEYKDIIAFRENTEALKTGNYNGYSSSAICAFTMEKDGKMVWVLGNVTNTETSYVVPTNLATETWSDAFTGTSETISNTISLAPYEYKVLEN